MDILYDGRACIVTSFFICYYDCIGIIILVSIVLVIAIPSQDTMYKMLAANYLTPANIESVGESVDKIADKVVEKINNIQK